MNIRGISTHPMEALVRSGQYWQTQREKEKKPDSAPGFTIALSRQVGARGTTVAREVGARLGWPVYDRELLEQIAREMDVGVQLVQSVDEKRVGTMQELIESFMALPRVNQDVYFRHLLDTIFSLASHGECIIVGRGAAQVLPPTTTLRVRLVANLDDRIAVMMKRLNISRLEAARIETMDRERNRFVKEHFHKDLTDPLGYDLVLNSSRFSDAQCADIILLALKQMQQRALSSQCEERLGQVALHS
jgi:cytidylate kinase